MTVLILSFHGRQKSCFVHREISRVDCTALFQRLRGLAETKECLKAPSFSWNRSCFPPQIWHTWDQSLLPPKHIATNNSQAALWLCAQWVFWAQFILYVISSLSICKVKPCSVLLEISPSQILPGIRPSLRLVIDQISLPWLLAVASCIFFNFFYRWINVLKRR